MEGTSAGGDVFHDRKVRIWLQTGRFGSLVLDPLIVDIETQR